MKTLLGIQYLRAFAATAVVVFHAAERAGLHFAIGAAGVDVFFVVSGFIMMAISFRRDQKPLAFLKDRLLRIAPSYWIVTAIMIAGAAAGLFPNLKLEPLHMLGSIFFLPVPSPGNGELWPVLVQGWTLNYEIFFYITFALTLLAPARLQLWLLAGCLSLFVILGTLVSDPGPLLTFYTRPLILEFAAGAALAKLWQAGRLPSAPVGFLLIACGIGGFAAVHVQGLDFGVWNCGPLAVMLVAGVLSVESAGLMPKMPLLAHIGDASYSTYLWHTLALSVVTKAGLALDLPPIAIAAAGIACGSLIGLMAYEIVEKPLQSCIKGYRARLDPALARPPQT